MPLTFRPAFLLLTLFALLLAALPAQSGVLEEVKARGVLRVGLTGDYKPYSWEEPVGRYPEGHMTGLDVDMATRLAADLGLPLRIVKTSWPTLMADLEAGHFDIAMGGISITLERKARAFFSTPVMSDGKTPITRCENADRFQTLEGIDREGVRVIVNPGGTNEKFARAHISRATLILHRDNASIFQEIIEGRADVMMTDATETRIMQKLHPELCALHPDAPFDRADKAYLLPRDPAWKAIIDNWLLARDKDGTRAALTSRWLD